MQVDVAGLGNALVDALVIVNDETLIGDLGLTRGTMHLVDHQAWQAAYERVRHQKVTFDSGGSCANTIATIGWLGGSATYCGQIGDDQMGRMYADRMTKACGNHSLQMSTEIPTGKCLSIISAVDAERTMVTDLGAAVSVTDLGKFQDALDGCRIAQFTGYTLLDGPMRDLVIRAMESAKASGAKVSIDAADPFVVSLVKESLWDILERIADIVFLNAEEARMLSDAEPAEAIHIIAKRANLDTVIVKLGGEGSLVLHEGELHKIPVRKVNAIDTTGAGDAYAGAFLFALVKGWPAKEAGNLASAVAAMTVAQVGAVVQDRELLASLVDELRPIPKAD